MYDHVLLQMKQQMSWTYGIATNQGTHNHFYNKKDNFLLNNHL